MIESQAGREVAAGTWLVLRAQTGSRAHLERLLMSVQAGLRRRLAFLLPNDADVDDVLQDVLFTISRRLVSLRDAGLFDAWARRIATRAAWRATQRGRWRALMEQRAARESDWSRDDPPLHDPAEIERLLAKASPRSRVVLTLHYVEGLTIEEVARELNVSVGTVKSRLAYGLQLLRGP